MSSSILLRTLIFTSFFYVYVYLSVFARVFVSVIAHPYEYICVATCVTPGEHLGARGLSVRASRATAVRRERERGREREGEGERGRGREREREREREGEREGERDGYRRTETFPFVRPQSLAAVAASPKHGKRNGEEDKIERE